MSSLFLLEVPDLSEFLTFDIALSVFVPEHWTGITGITPIDLQFSEQLPLSLRPKARPVNPYLYDNAEKEFKRLQTYFYVLLILQLLLAWLLLQRQQLPSSDSVEITLQ